MVTWGRKFQYIGIRNESWENISFAGFIFKLTRDSGRKLQYLLKAFMDLELVYRWKFKTIVGSQFRNHREGWIQKKRKYLLFYGLDRIANHESQIEFDGI